MNITSSPIKLVKAFSDVKSDMSRMDGNLTQWEHHGRTYPGSQVDDSFRSMCRELDDATLGFSDHHPSEDALLNELKSDTLELAYNAGMTYSMNQQATSFGSGWRNVMDPAISNAGEAIDVLTAAQEGGEKEQAPPRPVDVLKDLSDVQADLTRWDANLTQWESNGRTYPSRNVSRNLLGVASDLYDARNALRELHPEQTELLKALQSDIITVASDAGSTKHMWNHSVTFGSGWSDDLDRPIANVRRAIDVIAQGVGDCDS